MAEEIGKEATDKLQKANSKHIGLESISIVLKRILDCIIVSIVAKPVKKRESQEEDYKYYIKKNT